MKLLIASDIHGSYYYANIIKEAFEKQKCDQILLLGDLLYHGPRNDLPKEYAPKKVIPLLNALKPYITAVRGNCEAEVDQMVLEFPCMDDYATIKWHNRTLYASHGHIYSPDALPNKIQKHDVFLFGHIHIPVMECKDGIHILNPGSISIPKDNSAHSYGILEDDSFNLYDDMLHLLQSYFIKNDVHNC